MKITNPFSKSRFSKKENFQRAITKKVTLLKPYLKERRKGHNVLSSLYDGLHESFLDENVSIIDGVQVDLLSITVADLVPIEELSELKNGIKKMFKLYRPKFNINDPRRIDEFYDNLSNSIHGLRWSNLGYIQFDENTEIGKFISYVHIQATQVSSSIIVMHYQLHPSTTYLSTLKQLIDADFNRETIFKPRFRSIFSYWGSSTSSSDQVKKRQLEDYILELKWRFFSVINRHIPSFFYKNKTVPPGILLYNVKQKHCTWKYEQNDRNLFWESIGLPQRHSIHHDISADGAWQLHSDFGLNQQNLDDSIRISFNSEIHEFGHSNINDQIIYRADDLVKEVLPILAIRKYTFFMSKQIAAFRINTFKSIKNRKIEYEKILRQRLIIEQNGHMLTRIKSEIKPSYYERKKAQVKASFYEWEPVDTMFIKRTWFDYIVDDTEYLVNETYNHSESLVKAIDNTVQILTIQTNFSIQRRTVLLTVVTIILAVVAIYLTYYQISQETPRDLVNQLIGIFN